MTSTSLVLLQELLLILEEYWERSPELHNVPIYQASALARRAMSIYQTYIEMMNDDIQAAFQVTSSPFQQTVQSTMPALQHCRHLHVLPAACPCYDAVRD